MSDIICPECKTEYFLNHFKLPFKDEGETLYCKCGKELFSYEKSTDSYSLEEVGEYKKEWKHWKKNVQNILLVIVV